MLYSIPCRPVAVVQTDPSLSFSSPIQFSFSLFTASELFQCKLIVAHSDLMAVGSPRHGRGRSHGEARVVVGDAINY
jgi:hypothetical protein